MVDVVAKPHRAITDDDYTAMRSTSPEMYWTLKRNTIAISINKKPGDANGCTASAVVGEIVRWLIANTSDLYHYSGGNGGSYKQSMTVSFFAQNDALAFKLRFDGHKVTTAETPR